MSNLEKAAATVLLTLALAGAGSGVAQAAAKACNVGDKGENWVCVDGKRMSDGRFENIGDKGNR